MNNRLTAVLAGTIAGVCLMSAAARSGPTTYDMGFLLNEQHPFWNQTLPPEGVLSPLPPAQIRAPARVPQAAPPSRMAYRRAAEPNQAERIPATAAPLLAAAPPERAGGGLSSFLSEVRIGAMAHDEGPFSRHEESGFDVNFELLFVSPRFLHFVWSPRPHLGVTVNSVGDTSKAYAGLSWEWSFFGNWFAGFSLGGAIHDGKLTTQRTDRKELGCRVLFRESIDAGYRFAGRHGISAYFDHISNARLCSRNEGLEGFGLRYGYKF